VAAGGGGADGGLGVGAQSEAARFVEALEQEGGLVGLDWFVGLRVGVRVGSGWFSMSDEVGVGVMLLQNDERSAAIGS